MTKNRRNSVSGNVNQSYNNDFRVTDRGINGGNSIHFAYDDDLLLTQAGELTLSHETQKGGLINGTTLGHIATSRSYNGFAELTGYSASKDGNALYQASYSRDKLGRITHREETLGGQTTVYDYAYDLAGRLTEVKTNGVVTASYSYDSNGNRLGGVYDDQDRLLTWNGKSYSYTANGELKTRTEGGNTTTYTYDVLGNLTRVTLPGDITIDYIIDGQNRRIGKKVNGTLRFWRFWGRFWGRDT